MNFFIAFVLLAAFLGLNFYLLGWCGGKPRNNSCSLRGAFEPSSEDY